VDGDAIFLHLAEAYPNCPKYIRPRHLLVREPGRDDLPGPPLRSSSLSPSQRGWIRRADTFFIASFHPRGGADASHRGGTPGFVRANADGSLEFPDYAGNNMFNTLGNIVEQPRAGLLFLDFDSGDALQLTGEASLDGSGEAVRSHAGAAKLVVRFQTRAAI